MTIQIEKFLSVHYLLNIIQCYDQTRIDFGNISKEGFFIISFFMINFEINAIASYRNLQRQVPQFDCY